MYHSSLNCFIGIKLRKLRNSKNLSQSSIAYGLGISRNAYIDWERGKINFTLIQIQLVCEYYCLEISEFLKELPSPPLIKLEY